MMGGVALLVRSAALRVLQGPVWDAGLAGAGLGCATVVACGFGVLGAGAGVGDAVATCKGWLDGSDDDGMSATSGYVQHEWCDRTDEYYGQPRFGTNCGQGRGNFQVNNNQCLECLTLMLE